MPGDPESLGGYWLAGRLGAGVRGVVYDAYDGEGRRFAVKVPRGEVTEQLGDAVWRVAPHHLARVVAVGVDRSVPYIVSEFAEGPDLRQAVAVHGPYTGTELDALAGALATALRTLHAVGIAHRDLRPENVLLSPGGPTLIDLGVAAPGSLGTRTYLAPEVVTGRRAGPAADVFAWGAVLLFAATGRDPFHGDSPGGVMHRLLAVDPELDELPVRLRELVGRALSKDATARPTATDLPLWVEPPDAPEPPATAGSPRGPEPRGCATARLEPPGGLAGPRSLGEVAEEVYRSLTPKQREEAPGLLLRLLDGDAVSGDEHGTLARLTDAGLLVRESVRVAPTQTEVGKLVAVNGDRVIPASAALVHAWPRLRAWADDRRAAPTAALRGGARLPGVAAERQIPGAAMIGG
ncbi:serine/threonine-protein kinase [Nonomuraea cavernae]|uniref:serine/threonine-protein kinase n=1 Tax=Nonomuraea cavernae TaxID=2045107 RepID=UPI0033FAF0E9